MKAISHVLAVFVGFSGLAYAQGPPEGPSGTWRTVGFQPVTLVLKAEGSVITGTVSTGPVGTDISEGTIKGDVVAFKVQIPNGRTITFTGTLKGDEISFNREVRVPPGAEPGGANILGANGPTDFVVHRFNESNSWTGTIRNAPTPRNPDVNPNPRNVSIGFKKAPTPHWRWRGGDKQIDVRTFTFPMGTFDVSVFELEGDKLNFSVSRPGNEIKCNLARLPEGIYRGSCLLGGGNNAWLIDLKPPDNNTQTPAAAGNAR